MKRQGLNISVNELRKLADELESEIRQFNLEFGVNVISSKLFIVKALLMLMLVTSLPKLIDLILAGFIP